MCISIKQDGLIRAQTVYLGLSDNKLSGTISANIDGMTMLRTLYVYSNELTGELRQALSRLLCLRTLLLQHNSFKGSLSAVFQNVSLLKNSEFLDVSNNELLPSELFTLETIQTVAGVANLLSASLSPNICNASNLVTLSLDAQSCRAKLPIPWSSAYVTTSLGNLFHPASGILPT
jgi:hypothetical protein